MQSSKPSKKSVKKEEEKLVETPAISEAPKKRSSASSKVPKEKVEIASAKVHRKSPAATSVRVESNEPGPVKVMAAAAGAGSANGGIVDSVGVMSSSPLIEAPVAITAASREEIANLAYSYWEARGFTHGLADEDWIRAEAELLGRS
jgi:hypothetical protein